MISASDTVQDCSLRVGDGPHSPHARASRRALLDHGRARAPVRGQQRCRFPGLEADALPRGRGPERGRRRPADDRCAERPEAEARGEGDHPGRRAAPGDGGSGHARPWPRPVRRGRRARRRRVGALARSLIVGCGCRGLELGAELSELGWQVRGTSRRRDGLDAIEAAGLEPAAADPDRPGAVLELCGDVAVVVWLLGAAAGDVAAIHGPRLERLLEKLVDTPVRGFAYESAGSVDRDLLDDGRRIVQRAGGAWRIPVAFLDIERNEPGWARATADAVAGLVAG